MEEVVSRVAVEVPEALIMEVAAKEYQQRLMEMMDKNLAKPEVRTQATCNCRTAHTSLQAHIGIATALHVQSTRTSIFDACMSGL